MIAVGTVRDVTTARTQQNAEISWATDGQLCEVVGQDAQNKPAMRASRRRLGKTTGWVARRLSVNAVQQEAQQQGRTTTGMHDRRQRLRAGGRPDVVRTSSSHPRGSGRAGRFLAAKRRSTSPPTAHQ